MGIIADTLQNLFSGMGTGKDKSTHARWHFVPLGADEIENAYEGDWLSKKLINIPPEDMTREWRDWQTDSANIEKIEALEKSLLIQQKVTRAMQLARLDGGAGLLIGNGDLDMSLPLDPTKGNLKYLHIVRRIDLKAEDLNRDPGSIDYGTPTMWNFGTTQGNMLKIHPSRVIRLIGVPPIDPLRGTTDGWGNSIMQSVNTALRNVALSTQGVASLIDELKIDVISVPNLSKQLSTPDGSDRVTERFAYANMMKSMYNMILLGDNETWDRKEVNFNAMPQIMQLYLQIASGAADIPVTRLLGQSPAGMNSTGESDSRNYYDMLKSRQTNELSPALVLLDTILLATALGPNYDKSTYYEWAPLWQMTEVEAAAVALNKANTSKIYHDANVFPPEMMTEVIYNQLVEDGTYPGIEQAKDEYGLEPPEPEPVIVAPGSPQDPIAQAQQQAADAMKRVMNARVADATPQTLYVSRKVLNPQDIIDWAHSQGFETTLPADDMHVTVAFSREPVDWVKVGNDMWDNDKATFTVPRGGPRVVEKFGSATVLIFASSRLYWRHEEIKRAGASFDFPDYNPHITISYSVPEGFDLAKIKPYTGEIMLGQEDFAPVNEDWKAGVDEV